MDKGDEKILAGKLEYVKENQKDMQLHSHWLGKITLMLDNKENKMD